MSEVRIDGMEELVKRITTIQQMRRFKKALKAGAVHLHAKIRRAPKVSRRRNMRLYGNSPDAIRNRRGYFYHLQKGDIDVPYYRGSSKSSEKLSDGGWSISTEMDGWRAVVGTSVSYAPLVQDRDEQTSYHAQTGWETVQGVKNLHGRWVINRLIKALDDELTKTGN